MGTLDRYISNNYIKYSSVGGPKNITQAFDAITVYDKPIVVQFHDGGAAFGLVYKYDVGEGNPDYGMGLFMHYYSTDIIVLSVVNGVYTTGTISATS